MQTVSSQYSATCIDTNDLALLSLPLDQLVHRYVDEIFSDYSARKVTLQAVRDEIKAIVLNWPVIPKQVGGEERANRAREKNVRESMTTANEYRRHAEECVRSAHGAKTQEAKMTLLNVAKMWRGAAFQIESNNVGSVRTPRDRSEVDRIGPHGSARWRML